MKTRVSILLAGVFLVSVLLLASGCAQKVNNPADVQAINKCLDDYVKAMNAADFNAAVAMMSDNMVYADLNVPALAGKEAIRKMHQVLFEQFSFEFAAPVVDVRIAGG
jgi:ketosteroid isomerase-like protein